MADIEEQPPGPLQHVGEHDVKFYSRIWEGWLGVGSLLRWTLSPQISSNPTSNGAGQVMFASASDRAYAHDAVELFPWPVTAGYHGVHRFTNAGLAVHAAWQVRDVSEGPIKFLAAPAAADYLIAKNSDATQTSQLLSMLLKPQVLSPGDWPTLMELALKDGPPEGACLPKLAELLFRRRKPSRLARHFTGSSDSQCGNQPKANPQSRGLLL